ncbi:hypothetical protein, partial [uncultured Rikenella sp.]
LRAGPSAHPRSAQPEHDRRFGQTFTVRRTAPGYRHHAGGWFGGVGDYGYSWASAARNMESYSHGLYLHFTSNILVPDNLSACAHGRQLRCLSE